MMAILGLRGARNHITAVEDHCPSVDDVRRSTPIRGCQVGGNSENSNKVIKDSLNLNEALLAWLPCAKEGFAYLTSVSKCFSVRGPNPLLV